LLWYKFRRQKVVWSFILDFYCPKLLMWIELDGWYHNDRIEYDRFRDAEIYKSWIRVIRFTNEDIQKNLSWVID
jgi:very-short-patch-repair endonuclease